MSSNNTDNTTRFETLNDDFSAVRPQSYRRDVCAFLAHVEQNYDVNRLRYGNLHIWPILRCMLGSATENQVLGFRSFPQPAPVHEELVRELRGIFGDVVGRTTVAQQAISNVQPRPLSDLETEEFQGAVMVYSRHSRVMRKSSSLPFHNVDCDELVEDAAREMPCYAFEVFRGEKTVERTPRQVYPFFAEYVAANYEATTLRKDLNVYEQFVKDLEQFENVPTGTMPTAKALRGVLFNVVRRKQYFDEVLAAAKPCAVVVSLYYDFNEGTASLIWACKEAGIPTIEFQHGMIGKHHWAFTDWTKIPADGYKTLPSIVICWEKAAAHSLEESNVQGTGNFSPYVVPFKRAPKPVLEDTMSIAGRNLQTCAKPYDKVVMFTAQYGLGMIPSNIVSAILAAPKSWFWLIRLHPLGKPMIPTWIELLSEAGVTNYDINLVNELDINEAIEISDHIVCSFSSTAYEAILAGKPCTITTEIGLECMEEEIKNGNMAYAMEAAEIIESIENPTLPNPADIGEEQMGYSKIFERILAQYREKVA